jgi:NTP pyrophosphatase (non-canonical NTP hydrolase)
MKTLNKLRDEIHENAKQKGFYDGVTESLKICPSDYHRSIKLSFIAQQISLIHSEVSEILEAVRKDDEANLKVFEEMVNEKNFTTLFNSAIKGSIEDECADVIIRVLDLCGYFGIDIKKHIELKMKYNSQREYKHGKNF